MVLCEPGTFWGLMPLKSSCPGTVLAWASLPLSQPSGLYGNKVLVLQKKLEYNSYIIMGIKY